MGYPTRSITLIRQTGYRPRPTAHIMGATPATTPLEGAPMKTVEERRGELATAIAEQWEYELRESPELATIIGDYRYNDRWSDLSLAHVEQQQRDLEAWRARFEAVATAGLTEQEELDHRLMVRNLKERLEAIAFKNHEMPIDQLDGLHLQLAQFVSQAPFETAQQYEEYTARLNALPGLFDQVVEVLAQGARDGLLPPRYLLEKTVAQCHAIAATAGEANVFGRPAAKMPESLGTAVRERLRVGLVRAVDEQVRPAYTRLAEFIAAEYAPRGRVEPGIWSLPDGAARYRFLVRELTTTDMHPEAIHQVGIEEVRRIEAEQLSIARRLGFSSLAGLRESLTTERRLVATSRENILEIYRGYIEQMEPQLPRLFGLLPKARVEVRPMEEYREKEAAGAEYYRGAPDGSRPGIVYVNTGAHESRSMMSAEATAYHEALPGHHLQVSIAQSLPALHPFRRHAYYGAYIEGWALYAERLGKDIGFYQDPYSDFGRLAEELLRAVRLVLDTGVHHMSWTRPQMVEYFRAHCFEDESDIQAETDRYIVLPAQALSYKLGQLEILRLRDAARRELGPRYDMRRFHDKILEGGALPLDVLGERVSSWIENEAHLPEREDGPRRPDSSE